MAGTQLTLSPGQEIVWSGIDIYGLAADICLDYIHKWLGNNGESDAYLRLIEPLGPKYLESSVWLCEGPDQRRFALKLFAEDLQDKLRHDESEALDGHQITLLEAWRWYPSPE